jgi:hypothetical protein
LKKVEDTQRKHRLPCRFASTNIGIARNEYQMSKETINLTKALKEIADAKTVGRTRTGTCVRKIRFRKGREYEVQQPLQLLMETAFSLM